MRALLLLLLVPSTAGCASYVELQNTGNRIWIMSKDGKEIYRCYDMTAEGTVGHNSAVNVLCQRATLYN